MFKGFTVTQHSVSARDYFNKPKDKNFCGITIFQSNGVSECKYWLYGEEVSYEEYRKHRLTLKLSGLN